MRASSADIRIQDENKLLRARLQAAVDALDELLPYSLPSVERDRAQAVVRGERKLMSPTARLPRLFPGEGA